MAKHAHRRSDPAQTYHYDLGGDASKPDLVGKDIRPVVGQETTFAPFSPTAIREAGGEERVALSAHEMRAAVREYKELGRGGMNRVYETDLTVNGLKVVVRIPMNAHDQQSEMHEAQAAARVVNRFYQNMEEAQREGPTDQNGGAVRPVRVLGMMDVPTALPANHGNPDEIKYRSGVAMVKASGVTLYEHLHDNAGHRLSPDEVRDLTKGLVQWVRAAAEEDHVHMDLKAANIMYEAGKFELIDHTMTSVKDLVESLGPQGTGGVKGTIGYTHVTGVFDAVHQYEKDHNERALRLALIKCQYRAIAVIALESINGRFPISESRVRNMTQGQYINYVGGKMPYRDAIHEARARIGPDGEWLEQMLKAGDLA